MKEYGSIEIRTLMDVGLIDTMKDLFVNFPGSVVFYVCGYMNMKRGRGKGWMKNFVPEKKYRRHIKDAKKRKIVLVAESGADLKPEHIRKYGIYVVSMYVTMRERTLQDWSFPTADLYDYYERSGIIPKTSEPNVQDYAVMASEDTPYVVHVIQKA